MTDKILCFGELLVRLTAPGRETLLQSPRLDVSLAGAEANVAVALAHWGHSAAVLTALPENPLGRAALAEMRRYGVDTSRIQFRPGRMGLYFLEPGAMHRPSEITYDRSNSVFATTPPSSYDWERELKGFARLHVSGVTPAIGAAAAEAAIAALKSANRLGIATSFDGNHRAKLWSAWQGDAKGILAQIFECTGTLFANERDISVVLGTSFDSLPAEDRMAKAAELAFAKFPRLERMYGTVRIERSVDDHQLSAELITRKSRLRTARYELRAIVDRIGTGDAFAAGVLHGLLRGLNEQRTLDLGIASACLKHSVPGDFNLVRPEQLDSFLADGGFSVRR